MILINTNCKPTTPKRPTRTDSIIVWLILTVAVSFAVGTAFGITIEKRNKGNVERGRIND